MKSSTANPTRRLDRRAFTIIELMVVLLLIGVLMGIAAINLPGVLNRGKERATKASQGVIAGVLSEYSMSHSGAYPESLQVLVEQEYLSKMSDISDSWGVPMQLIAPSQVNGVDVEFEIRSAGKDKVLGTTDDIVYYHGMDNN